jgi:hypothetical protein
MGGSSSSAYPALGEIAVNSARERDRTYSIWYSEVKKHFEVKRE